MEEQKKKRIRRTKDAVIADEIAMLEEKIAKYEELISKAKQRIEELRTPPKPQVKMKDIAAKVKALDIPLEDVMKAIDKMAKK